MRSVNVVAMENRVEMPDITVTSVDFKGVHPEQDEPMVITIEVVGCLVRKTLIDQGSSTDILF